MNLLENEEVNKRSKMSKVTMTIISIMILILVAVAIWLGLVISDLQKNMVKLTIDAKKVKSFTSQMFLFEDDTIYVSIKDFAPLVGYTVYKGDHKSENETMGYIQNSFEEASYTLNSNKIYKQLLTETDNEYYTIEKMVKMENDKLYMSLDGIQIATNSSIAYNESTKQFTVYTLPYLATYYAARNKDSVLLDEKVDYSNKKAILYKLVVVQNANKQYGVRSIDGTEIIGAKYKSIKFMESTQDFIVTSDDDKMGIMSSEGKTKISANYDEIRQIQKDLKLYLVRNDKKYGVINQNENIILHIEYDSIGIDISKYQTNYTYSNHEKNRYVLFKNCIPVEKNSKWGIFDISGRNLVPVEYDEIGCSKGSTNGSKINLLMIPEYAAIVVRKGNQYGLVNYSGEVILNCVLDSFYIDIETGKALYKMEQGTQKNLSVEAWMIQQGIPKVNPTDDDITVDEIQLDDEIIRNEVTSSSGTQTTNEVSSETTNVNSNGTNSETTQTNNSTSETMQTNNSGSETTEQTVQANTTLSVTTNQTN